MSDHMAKYFFSFTKKTKKNDSLIHSMCPQVKKPVVKEWCYKPSDLKSPSTRLALSQFFSN